MGVIVFRSEMSATEALVDRHKKITLDMGLFIIHPALKLPMKGIFA